MMRLFALLLLLASPLWATVRYVDNTATGTGDGLSWANALTALPTSGISAGDTVYISGGPSGTTQTYNRAAFWNPQDGSAGNITVYQIGQDSSHNGTAIFHYTGATPNSDPFLSGSSYVTISGDAGDGLQHFKLTSFTYVSTNNQHFRIGYLDCSAGVGASAGGTAFLFSSATGVEIDHCNLKVGNLDSGSLMSGSFTGATYDINLFHHNTISVPYGSAGIGSDAFALSGDGISVYNNTITGYSAAYTAGEHQDGWQTLGGNYLKAYNNVFVDMANYAVYGEGYLASGFAHVRIYNNLAMLTDSALAAGSPGGFIFGVSSGFLGTPPCVFSDVVIANNDTIDYGSNQASVALNNVTGFSATFTGCYVANNISLASGAINTTGNATSTVANNVSVTTGNGAANFVTYVQYGGTSNNYNLKAGASTLIGQGTDLSAYFTTDAAGYTRTVPWDIGAYKYLVPSSSLTGNVLLSGNVSIK